MAGAVPDTAVGFLLEKLNEFVTYNAHLIGGIDNNAKKLCDDLGLMNALIKKYTEENAGSDDLEQLDDEIRRVVQQAEDAIEEYIIFKVLQKSTNFRSQAKYLLSYVSDLRKVGKQIGEARKNVSEFYKKKASVGNQKWKDQVESKRSKKEKKKVNVVEEDNIVGLEDETKTVIELLIGESPELQVISIIGMLGLGKTTLAKKVLSDPVIEYEFYPRAFVTVSEEYERKEVFLNILGAFTELTPALTAMSDVQLAEVLEEQLKNRKYLIVMDDVWAKEAWNQLKVAFPNNDKGSRVLITSRINNVAVHANPNRDPHYLRFMAREDAQKLLRRKVFGENNCPPELQEYEERILLKCDGLPLAIVVVAGILLNHSTITDWWIKVVEAVNDYLAKDTVIGDLIKLSYNNLPYHLKSCFLYLGVFPADFEIPVWKLLRLWIAEGFILKDGDMMLEDIAEDYLEDLVDRNFVMVGQRRLNGKIKTCRVHETLSDFCKKEAQKENLFREIRKFRQSTFLSEHPTLHDYRRICINAYVLDYVTSKPTGRRLRSFLTSAKEETTLPLDQISSIPKAFRLLRVLDVRSIVFTAFPIELISLVLLKYIALSSIFNVLPEKMADLINLQTIIIKTTSPTLAIKADILMLALLRHLHTNTSTCLVNVTGKSSTNATLQTLSLISPECCKRELFDKTPQLKKLGIFGKLATVIEANGDSTLFDCIVKLGSLENLKLLNDDIANPLYALPRETNFPRKLMRLTISRTLLDWKHMSTLGKLENLEVLKLKEDAFQGDLWETEDGDFRRLKVLHIGSMNLALWRASACHFPLLTSLFIKHCNKLEAVPSSFADIAVLQRIDLYCTNTSVAASARKIERLKLRLQIQKRNTKSCMFKLSVYPPDE